jgi:hypothetical protein
MWNANRECSKAAYLFAETEEAQERPHSIYPVQLWGTASTSNIEILERFQSKALGMIVDAPWYVPNTVIRRDLQTPTATAATALNTVLASAHTQTA